MPLVGPSTKPNQPELIQMKLIYKRAADFGYVAPSRLYGNSRVFGKVHGINGEQSGEHLNLSLFIQGFSSPDVAEISAPAFRIFLVSSTALETNI